ncbi:MAG: GNAT family N-acetyltransferase [Pseudomonadota bacterium]
MVTAFHEEMKLRLDESQRLAGVLPLLDGTPHGAAYLIGPRRAPVGYLVVSFGWSVEFGGVDGFLDEIYVRPAVRGRGMGGDAISALFNLLKRSDVRALHLEVDRESPAAGLYRRLGFSPRLRYSLMTWTAP